jgi:hypothetical protein
MLAVAPSSGSVSILTIEVGMTAIAVALAFSWPRLGSVFFSRVEGSFQRLAHRRGLSVTAIGLAVLILRMAMLPMLPIPKPVNADDFSFLFAADTFAHGRITNPTPTMWTHFETMHISMKPAYVSMFFPAEGLVLALGQVLFGQPWFGMLLASALMCATLCWMLQGWLPPGWALLGGMLIVLRIGLFSYWINMYTGGGTVAALGGALVLGALPRIVRGGRLRNGVLLATGVLILANSRPFEGLLLCLPVLFVLGRWLLVGTNRPALPVLLRAAVIPAILMLAAGSWMAYYNYRNFGSPLTLPYTVNRATYAVAPHFIWESPTHEPVYRYKVMRDYYVQFELAEFQKIHSISGFLPQTLIKLTRVFLFFSGLALIPPLIMVRRVFMDRRTRFLVLCLIPLIIGLVAEAGIRSYYLAPFVAVFYAVGLQAMRHMRHWKPGGQPVGSAMVRFLVTTCVVLAAVDLWARPLHLGVPLSQNAVWTCECLGAPQPGAERARIETVLEQMPGKQLVLVRYGANHNPIEEWVYNSAEIDSAKVIWARDSDSSNNEELIRYYKDRQVWLVQPDIAPALLEPYISPQQSASVSH